MGRRPHSPRAVDHHHLPPGRDWTNLKSNLTILPHIYLMSYFYWYTNVERCMSVILFPMPYLGGQYTTGTTIAAWKVKGGGRTGLNFNYSGGPSSSFLFSKALGLWLFGTFGGGGWSCSPSNQQKILESTDLPTLPKEDNNFAAR